MGEEEKPFYDPLESLLANVENSWGNVENFLGNVEKWKTIVEKWKTTPKNPLENSFFPCAFVICPERGNSAPAHELERIRLFSRTIKESNGFLF